MSGVLHLVDLGAAPGVDLGADGALLACASERQREPASWVCVVGGSADERRAGRVLHSAGWRIDARLAPSGRDPSKARSALRRLVNDRGQPREVVAWTTASYLLAWEVFRGDLACPIRLGRGDPAAAPTADPIRKRADRSRLGVRPDQAVILLLGDAPADRDAPAFVRAAALIAAAGRPVLGVIPEGSAGTARALRAWRLGQRSDSGSAMVTTDATLPELVRFADVAICTRPASAHDERHGAALSPMTLGVCAAAGLDIVREGRGSSRCLALSTHPTELARVACELLSRGGERP